jgi:serine/threonine protein kinase
MARLPRICATCGVEYEADALFCPKDGTPLGSSRNEPGQDPYLGQMIGDQIEIRQLIGIGSMGRVYRAWQRGVERDVAVKLLHRELSANGTLVGRFLREARIASRLQHPNVVQVLMAGQQPAGSSASSIGNELYIVMEYLDGISLLSALAASGGALALPRALHVVLQICDAVGEAHAQGIVHRDLKPENVVLVRRGNDPDFAKVLDFGIARLDWGQGSVATQAGLIFGTARYISPEGARGDPVGPAADVYSIATILYQCLSGRTPFENESPMALLMMHTYEAPPPIASIPRASYLPGPLAAAIMRNLDKQPDKRAPDARSLGRELVDAARASGLSPDDLVPRSTLLGQRGSAATSFKSIERTNKLQLSARVANLIGAHGAPGGETACADPTGSSGSLAAPDVATVVAGPPEGYAATTPASAVAGRASVPSAPPLRVSATPVSPPVPAPLPTAHGTSRTLDDDDVLESNRLRRRRARALVVVLACFLGGAGLVSFAAHQMGYLGSRATVSASTYAQRAESALRDRRWNAPPGNNVRDITDEGLRRFPGDPAIVDVRRRAAQELVTSSLGRKYAGDLAGALSDARLACELAAENTTAQRLLEELRGLMDAGAPVTVESAEVTSPDAGSNRRGTEPRIPPRSGGAGSGHIGQPPAGASSAPPPSPSDTSGRWL